MRSFKALPGEKHADYLTRLREQNACEHAETGPALQAISEARQERRARLLAAINTIPDEEERAFALSQL